MNLRPPRPKRGAPRTSYSAYPLAYFADPRALTAGHLPCFPGASPHQKQQRSQLNGTAND